MKNIIMGTIKLLDAVVTKYAKVMAYLFMLSLLAKIANYIIYTMLRLGGVIKDTKK